MPGILTREQFTEEYEVTRFFAASYTGRGVYSAIVNIRLWSDRRRVKKVYMYFDHKLNGYVTERA